MSDSPIDLELRLLPDWLKEPASKNPYANYQGEPQGRSPRRPFSDGPRRPSQGRPRNNASGQRNRQGQQERQGRQGGSGPARDRDGARNAHPGSKERRNERQDRRGPHGPHGPHSRSNPNRADDAKRRNDRQAQAPQTPEQPPIPLQVDFLPEQEALAALLQQIKGSNRAYPLYGVGRMFLNKPERHRVRIVSNAPSHPLYQVGENGPIYLNRAQAERDAFRHARNDFYREETTEIDPPKGAFTNVARCRVSGVLLGPTNHHGYQLALRRLYEARFSRRMEFAELQRQIEVLTDPELVEEWKKQASTVITFHTTREEEAKEFKTVQEVEDHFRQNYITTVVREAQSTEISGEASRKLNERRLRDAVRDAWEKERGFPAQTVGQIRPHLGKEGLHVWKHRKRILFISTQRPTRFDASGANVSENVRAILEAIEATPKCTRNALSQQLLKPLEDGCDEAAQAAHAALKTALAADLHWLLQAGHVIEFHDGTLDLPLPPKAPQQPQTAAPAPTEAAENTPVKEGAEGTAPQDTPASAAAPLPEAPSEAIPAPLSTPSNVAAPEVEQAEEKSERDEPIPASSPETTGTTTKEATAEQATAEQATAEQATAEQTSAEQTSAEQATAEQGVTENGHHLKAEADEAENPA